VSWVNGTTTGNAVPHVVRALREHSRTAHHRLDHHSRLQCLVRAGLTREAYGASLRALYRPQAQLEAIVAAGAERFGLVDRDDAPAPSRLAALESDLRTLGESIPAVAPHALLLAETPAVLVGQRYVLDGSRLGGQVIARQVAHRLGSHVPCHFFAAADPAWHWQRFLAFAERHCTLDQVDEAVAAAQQAFRHYLACLDAIVPG